MLTLAVHSSLEAVGFIAVLSRALAGAGVACNVVSGYHHDHVFVAVEKADEAVAVLEGVARDVRSGDGEKR